MEVLRRTEVEEDAIAILRLLRDSDSLDDAVQMVADASMLARVAGTESRPRDEYSQLLLDASPPSSLSWSDAKTDRLERATPQGVPP